MIENLLSSILGSGNKPEGDKKENGSILSVVIVLFLILGGLKLLSPKQEDQQQP